MADERKEPGNRKFIQSVIEHIMPIARGSWYQAQHDLFLHQLA